MPRHPTVGVHDDLAAGQSGVAMRPADDEPPGRVDEELDPGVAEARLFQYRPNDVLDDGLPDASTVPAGGRRAAPRAGWRRRPCGRATGLSPSYSTDTWDLPSGRSQSSWSRPWLPLRTAASRSAIRWASMIGQRHPLAGLARGIPEHHALVARALRLVACLVHAHRDVGRLTRRSMRAPRRCASRIRAWRRCSRSARWSAGRCRGCPRRSWW